MWAKIIAFFEIIKTLLQLWSELTNQIEVDKAKKRLEKELARKKAIEDLEKAKTEEEIWDAQKRLVDNRP